MEEEQVVIADYVGIPVHIMGPATLIGGVASIPEKTTAQSTVVFASTDRYMIVVMHI